MSKANKDENAMLVSTRIGVGGDNATEALQNEKLRLEIEELRNWWRRPAYIQSVFSILIALIASTATLITGYVNGWFDVQQGRLEIRRAQVQADIAALEAGRTTLNEQMRTLSHQRDMLQNTISETRTQLQAVTHQYHDSLQAATSAKNSCLTQLQQLSSRFAAVQANLDKGQGLTKEAQKAEDARRIRDEEIARQALAAQ